jgi:phosphohistidine phosphatase
MKTLILIRHAKSDWSTAGQNDYDRPLNARGKTDAPNMGKRLIQHQLRPDLIVSSPALRAGTTAQLIARSISYPVNAITFDKGLYLCDIPYFETVIFGIDNTINTLAIVSHNNGLTDFVNSINNFKTENVPTCGIVAFDIHTDRWEDFPSAPKNLRFFEYPKMFK